jgi:hypothetical protein
MNVCGLFLSTFKYLYMSNLFGIIETYIRFQRAQKRTQETR